MQLFLVDAAASEVVEGFLGDLDHVLADEGRAFLGSLDGILEAAFPFDDGPTVIAVLGEQREKTGPFHLTVTSGAEAASAFLPG